MRINTERNTAAGLSEHPAPREKFSELRAFFWRTLRKMTRILWQVAIGARRWDAEMVEVGRAVRVYKATTRLMRWQPW